MDLVWVTDPHFNLLGAPQNPRYVKEHLKRFGSPYDFGEHLAKMHPTAHGAVISGDIAEAHSVKDSLTGFSKGWGKPVYFVLGNHDYWGASWKSVNRQLDEWDLPKTRPLVWLRKAGVVELAPDLALCGHEGWYDGRAGAAARSRIIMNDWDEIKEMRNLHDLPRRELIAETARHWTAEAEIHLREACSKYKNVVFVTHFPPFPDSAKYGQPSDDDWLPWTVNVTLGDTLIELAYEYPETSILVLCGHTHLAKDVRMAPNLRVLTGHSEYWYPQVSGVLRLPEQMPLLR